MGKRPGPRSQESGGMSFFHAAAGMAAASEPRGPRCDTGRAGAAIAPGGR